MNDLPELSGDPSVSEPVLEPGIGEEGGAGGGFRQKLAELGQKLFGITKFVLGLLLLPFVYTVSAAFINELSLIDSADRVYFWSGVLSLLIIHHFIWEPAVIYRGGYKIVEFLFRFFKPLVRVAPYLLPVYTLVLFMLFPLVSLFWKDLTGYLVFLSGFTLTLHLIFSAKTMRAKKGDFLKGNYIFGFSFIYMINIFLLALMFNFIFEKFSFVNFCNYSYQVASNIITRIFTQLFVPA